jgi:hypothetical protein
MQINLLGFLWWWQYWYLLQLFHVQPTFQYNDKNKGTRATKSYMLKESHLLRSFYSLISLIHCLHSSIDKFLIGHF